MILFWVMNLTCQKSLNIGAELKILHIIDDLSPGGAERLLEGSLPLIKSLGNEVILLLLEDNQCHYRQKIINSGIPIIVSPINNMKSFKNISEIKKIIKKENVDVVHAHLFPVLYWVAFAKIFSKKFPLAVYTEHGVSNRRRQSKYFKLIENSIYKKYDYITCISTIVKNNLLNWADKLEGSKTKVNMIENGIDLSQFSIEKNIKKVDLGFDFSNVKFITMIGRLDNSKDQKTIINALKLLPINIQLILVGVGKNSEILKEYVAEKCLNDRVHFLGYRKDIKEILNITSIVILSSYKEGFGLAALEGMAMQKPVIGTNIDGLSQVIANNELLIEIGDYNELAKKIMEILVNERLYQELSEYCYERSKAYDISNMVDKWVNIYKNGAIS